ncbi:MAG TPA: hypothetical protein VM285_09500 [Polyangia bacterium]|nr:hypothetical protein [Polyangia bacterium]
MSNDKPESCVSPAAGPVKVIGDVEEKHDLMARRAKQIYVELAARYLAGGMVEIGGGRESATVPPR